MNQVSLLSKPDQFGLRIVNFEHMFVDKFDMRIHALTVKH